MSFAFASPWYALLFLLLPALVFYRRHWLSRPAIKVPQANLFQNVSGKHKVPFSLSEHLFFAALFCLIAAAMRPQTVNTMTDDAGRGVDIFLALDLSGSMRAIDLPENAARLKVLPPDRLTAAKQELAKLVRKRPDDRFGLLGFADLAYPLSPLTMDHDALLERLDTLEVGMLGEFTNLAAPIATAVRCLVKSTAPRRVLILFTDGANTAASSLTPSAAAKLAAEKKIIIYTVGIGSERAAAEFNGQLVPISGSYDADQLHELAELTGGKFFAARDESGLRRVLDEINRMEKTEFHRPLHRICREYAAYPLTAALLLLLAAMLCRYTKELSLP